MFDWLFQAGRLADSFGIAETRGCEWGSAVADGVRLRSGSRKLENAMWDEPWTQSQYLQPGEGGVCRLLVLEWFRFGDEPFRNTSSSDLSIKKAQKCYQAKLHSQVEFKLFDLTMSSTVHTMSRDDGPAAALKRCMGAEYYLMAFGSDPGNPGHAIGIRDEPNSIFEPNWGFFHFDDDEERLAYLTDVFEINDQYPTVDIVPLWGTFA